MPGYKTAGVGPIPVPPGGTAVASNVPSLHIVDNPLSVQQQAVGSAATPPAGSDMHKMMALAMLQRMAPAGHGLVQIDYDPYKVIAGSKMSGETAPTTPFRAYKVSIGSGEAPSQTLGLPGQRLGVESLMRNVLGTTGPSSPRGGVREQEDTQFGP